MSLISPLQKGRNHRNPQYHNQENFHKETALMQSIKLQVRMRSYINQKLLEWSRYDWVPRIKGKQAFRRHTSCNFDYEGSSFLNFERLTHKKVSRFNPREANLRAERPTSDSRILGRVRLWELRYVRWGHFWWDSTNDHSSSHCSG